MAPLLGYFMSDVLLLKYDFGITGLQAEMLNSLSATPKHAQLMDMMFIQGYGDVWENVNFTV